MFWLLKILTNKKLVLAEKKVRVKYIEDTNFLIAEIRKLNDLKKTVLQTEVQANPFLKAIYNSDLKQMIFVLEMINKTTNFLWVSRKKIEEIRKYVLKVRNTLKHLVSLSGLNSADNFIAKKDTRSIFALAKLPLDLEKVNFSFDDFKAAV